MVEGVLDAVAEGIGRDAADGEPEGAANRIPAKRKGKGGLLAPPLPEIEQLEQSLFGIGQLAFVDDETGIELAGENGRDDLVEGDDRGLDPGLVELSG